MGIRPFQCSGYVCDVHIVCTDFAKYVVRRVAMLDSHDFHVMDIISVILQYTASVYQW